MKTKRSIGSVCSALLVALMFLTACRWPASEQRVDIGGRELAYRCRGQGSPTVVIDTGGGDPGSTWKKTLPHIAEFTRVCIYSRAGLGTSDAPRPGPRTVEHVVEELRALLVNAEIPEPYVLVGHSIGGIHVRGFAARFPDSVAGMVLVDTTHEHYVALQDDLKSPVTEAFQEARRQGKPPKTIEGIADLGAYLDAAGDLPHLGDLPLIVLGSTRKPDLETWRARMPDEARRVYEQHRQEIDDHRLYVNDLGERLVRDQAELSTRGRYIEVTDAGHFIHLDRPDVVIEAIREVVEAATR